MKTETVAFAPAEGLWTVKDVAAYLQLSRSWVYQRAELGELPCIRLGGALRFEPEAIRRWLAKQRGGDLVALRQR
jgi:excisionase family DNA binding protein